MSARRVYVWTPPQRSIRFSGARGRTQRDARRDGHSRGAGDDRGGAARPVARAAREKKTHLHLSSVGSRFSGGPARSFPDPCPSPAVDTPVRIHYVCI